MTLTPKQKKIVAVAPIIILTYLAATLILYDLFLEPQINKITGGAISKVNISHPPPSYCNFSLYEGENLISFHCMNGIYPIDFLLNNISQNYISIFSYFSQDPTDPWKSYNPSLPTWTVQDLGWIYDEKGYWIIMNKNSSYFFEGTINMYPKVYLYKGWNLIGFTKETPAAIEDFLAGIDGHYNLVLQYKKETDLWYYYSPDDNSSTLLMIEPNYGYWINMSQDDMLEYS